MRIGSTPLARLIKIEKLNSLSSRLFAKLECLNEGGSAKDRIAKNMLDTAEREGILKSGGTIIEPTSGNTGIGLAMIGGKRGYRVIIVMPDSMSKERIDTIVSYGAEVVLTSGALGMAGAISKAEELYREIEGAFIPSQFENPANPMAHYLTTAPEIYEKIGGSVDYFVCGIGTGGTISGVGKYLKEKNPNIKIVGVEPLSSPLLTKGVAGSHKIQGIGANFIPSTLDLSVVDEIITVSNEDAYEYTKYLYGNEGIMAGISSGANLCASLLLAKREKSKTIVFMVHDKGERYLSTGVFD